MVNTAALFAIVLSAVGAQPRGEVIDFSMSGCSPCRQMAPIVDNLAREGHPIRTVYLEQDPQLVERFGVTRYPTFILLVDGKVVQRESGLLSEDALRMMLARIPKTEVVRPGVGNNSGNVAAGVSGAGALTSNAIAPPGPFRSVLGDAAPLPRPQTREAAAPKVAQREEAAGLWPFSKKKPAAPEVRGSSEELAAASGATPAGEAIDLFATNARLRVRIGDKFNLGSGTIIESKPGRTLIMTCGHIFRGIAEDSKIAVDLAPWDRPRTFVGTLIRHDLDADVGLVSISTDAAIPVVPVARRAAAPKVGEQMVCVGCSGGQAPTREQIRITAIDKYEGASTIECEGLPVQGRSGGGLFDTQGRLVGVCINADPAAQRGIYAGLAAIHDLLTQSNFAYLYQDNETRVAAAETSAAPKSAPRESAVSAAELERSDPFPSRDRGHAFETASAQTQPAAAESGRDIAFSGGTGGRPVDVSADDAEVVVIIRQKGKPESANRVILIHEASPKFFQYLQGELSPGAAEAGMPSAAVRVRRPINSLVPSHGLAASSPPVATATAAVPDVRASKAGLQQTALSEEFQPRPFVRKK